MSFFLGFSKKGSSHVGTAHRQTIHGRLDPRLMDRPSIESYVAWLTEHSYRSVLRHVA
jgi:hypothetical protein